MTTTPDNKRLADLDAETNAACGPVSHDEARAILSRFVNSHFKNPGEKARMSIPADPKRDDDLRMAAYIAQCREHDTKSHTDAEVREGEERSRANLLAYVADDASFEAPMSGHDIVIRDAVAALRKLTATTTADRNVLNGLLFLVRPILERLRHDTVPESEAVDKCLCDVCRVARKIDAVMGVKR